VLCKIGTIGWSVDGEYVEGRGSLVTGWGRMGGEGMGLEREWVRRGRTSCWEGEQWILAQEEGE
jgi:hypothetical protein